MGALGRRATWVHPIGVGISRAEAASSQGGYMPFRKLRTSAASWPPSRVLVPAAVALLVSCASPDAALASEGIGAKQRPGVAASAEPCALADAGPVVEILRRGDFDGIAA